jgi:hypothetical protein
MFNRGRWFEPSLRSKMQKALPCPVRLFLFNINAVGLSAYAETTGSTVVIVDKDALYFGAHLNDLTLVPQSNAKLGSVTFEQWFPTRPLKH